MKTTKNLLFIALMFAAISGLAQTINKELDGYTEIVKVDSLKKKEIYGKLKEWISINYKSANDVVQLDTEDKIIVKGNFTVNYSIMNTSQTLRVINTLIFSIKDYRYMIDLKLNEMYNVSYPSVKMGFEYLEIYITGGALNKDEFLEKNNKLVEQLYANMGYSESKIKKMMNFSESTKNEVYTNYLSLYNNLNQEIKSTYSSIKVSVLKADDAW